MSTRAADRVSAMLSFNALISKENAWDVPIGPILGPSDVTLRALVRSHGRPQSPEHPIPPRQGEGRETQSEFVGVGDRKSITLYRVGAWRPGADGALHDEHAAHMRKAPQGGLSKGELAPPPGVKNQHRSAVRPSHARHFQKFFEVSQ